MRAPTVQPSLASWESLQPLFSAVCFHPWLCVPHRTNIAASCCADLGSAYGTAKSGVGLASMGVIHADRVMRNIIPVIMAGILGIYGLIVGAILVGRSTFCLGVSEILPQGLVHCLRLDK